MKESVRRTPATPGADPLAMCRSPKSKILAGLYKRRRSSRILDTITRIEGGQMRSLTLRSLLSTEHGVQVGDYSYGSLLTPGMADPHTTIGRYVSIGPNVRRFGASHPLNAPSLHPYWYNPALGFVARDSDVERGAIHIADDCWIGANVTILPTVTRIGIGSVIGAGSVVTRDVEDFSIVVGNPARHIRYRLNEQQRDALLADPPWAYSPSAAFRLLSSLFVSSGSSFDSRS